MRCCSQEDPDSSNEMQRQHKPGDPRCSTQFGCPSCEERFNTKEGLQEHIVSHHDLSMTMPSMRSEADDSTWKYVKECSKLSKTSLSTRKEFIDMVSYAICTIVNTVLDCDYI